jgi:molybdopterin adenylyltransferase
MSVPLIAIVTSSDRAAAGTYEDRSGPAIEAGLRQRLATVCRYERRIVADEPLLLMATLSEFAAAGAALICSTGSTGPAPRDVMPEVMERVCDKLLPGFGEAMRSASLAAGVPTAILSRQTAGVIGRTLVVNLPGRPAAIETCLAAVFPAIPMAIDLIGGPYLEGDPTVVAVYRPPSA